MSPLPTAHPPPSFLTPSGVTNTTIINLTRHFDSYTSIQMGSPTHAPTYKLLLSSPMPTNFIRTGFYVQKLKHSWEMLLSERGTKRYLNRSAAEVPSSADIIRTTFTRPPSEHTPPHWQVACVSGLVHEWSIGLPINLLIPWADLLFPPSSDHGTRRY